ncbi:protein translocase subunit SecD [bacterium]|nr:protein translocase subunit SecD [bacterium]
MKSLKWRFFVVLALTIGAIYAAAPTFIYFGQEKEVRNDEEAFNKAVPDYLPKSHVKLGLDIQGGVQLVLGVETAGAVDTRLGRIAVEATRWSEDNDLSLESAYVLKGKQTMIVKLGTGSDFDKFLEDFKKEFLGLELSERDGSKLSFKYTDDQVKRIKQSALEQAERVIRTRIDKWGVSEPVINRRQNGSILVQLPGFKNPEKAKELLGRTAQLQFKIVDGNFDGFSNVTGKLPEGLERTAANGQTAFVGEDRTAITAYLEKYVPEDRMLLFEEAKIGNGKSRWTSVVVFAATEITGDDVMDASVGQGSGLDTQPQVSLRFTGVGGKRFGDVTGKNVGKLMAIVLDDVVVSAPNIQAKITGGSASITLGGNRSYQEVYDEANQLALILKSGSVPATITVLEERQVGATLGPELADQGVKGILVGLGAVLCFMLVYYRRPGTLACVVLTLNGLYLLAVMAGFGFSLTLPGIAGFILTLGMAVDANVLINERVKQELRHGKNARNAVEHGFGKVFWTIIDANVTTLIAAVLLLETNSSGPIRGFAVTLMIGLIISMFTSLYVTKTFFDGVLSTQTSDDGIRKWFGAANQGKKWNVNFLGFGKPVTGIVLIASLAVLGMTATKGLNWGVDFAGGTEIMLGFDENVEAKELGVIGDKAGLKNMTIQALEGGKKQYLLRYESATKGEQNAASSSTQFKDFKDGLLSKLNVRGPEILQVDFVGPQIGKELRSQGVASVVYAIIGVLLYIALRFDMRFGPGAVVKMILDVFLVLGFYVLFWRTFDLTSVAAFLTVVGYSVNDTIVIYDRIRENLTNNGRRSLIDNINISLNETLTRTLNTSVTTVAALLGILIFCTGQLWTFAMAMAIGVIVATVSSTFVASSFLVWSEDFKKARAAKGKAAKA